MNQCVPHERMCAICSRLLYNGMLSPLFLYCAFPGLLCRPPAARAGGAQRAHRRQCWWAAARAARYHSAFSFLPSFSQHSLDTPCGACAGLSALLWTPLEQAVRGMQQAVQAHCMCPAAAGPPRPALTLPGSLLASLRARKGLGSRHGSRASISVAERSELRAAGSQEGSAAQPPQVPPQVPLPSGPELLRQHLTPTQCEHVTHEILRTFLAVEGSSRDGAHGNGSSRRGRRQAAGPRSDHSSSNGNRHDAAGSSSSRQPLQHSHAAPSARSGGSHTGSKGGEAAQGPAQQPQQRRRGLQGQVAEHLLSGGFDEAVLEPVPTHTLNWVIKVRRCGV